jgi:hypothetical protein
MYSLCNVFVKGTLTVLSNADFQGEVAFPGSLTTYGSIRTYGPQYSYSHTTYSNASTFASNVLLDGHMTVYKGITMQDTAFFSNQSLVISSNVVQVNAPMEVKHDVSILGNIKVSKSVDIKGKLTVNGDSVIKTNMVISPNITSGNIAIESNSIRGVNTLVNITNIVEQQLYASNITIPNDGVFTMGPIIATHGSLSNIIGISASNFKINGDIEIINKVGIGLSSPVYPLHVDADIDGISIFSSADICAFSDARVKKDLLPIVNALDKIELITGYTFLGVEDTIYNRRRCGLIAQEVIRVLPEAVHLHEKSGYLTLSYGNLIALVINAIKELRAELRDYTLS